MLRYFQKEKDSSDPIQKEHHRLISLAKQQGQAAGQQNKPSNGDSITTFIGQLKAGYQALIASHVSAPVATLAYRDDKAHRRVADENKGNLEKQIESLKENLRKKTLQKDHLPQDGDHGKYIGLHVLIFILACFEGFYSSSALSVFSHHNNLARLLVFAGLALIFYFLPRAIVYTIQQTENHSLKWPIRLGVAAIIISSLSTLAILRGLYLQNFSATTLDELKVGSDFSVKPIYFVCLNLLMLFIGVFCTLQLPSREQKKTGIEEARLDREIEELQAEIRNKEAQIYAFPNAINSEENKRVQALADIRQKADYIHSLYHMCVGEYIEANLKWRSTPSPDCFNQIPELTIPNI